MAKQPGKIRKIFGTFIHPKRAYTAWKQSKQPPAVKPLGEVIEHHGSADIFADAELPERAVKKSGGPKTNIRQVKNFDRVANSISKAAATNARFRNFASKAYRDMEPAAVFKALLRKTLSSKKGGTIQDPELATILDGVSGEIKQINSASKITRDMQVSLLRKLLPPFTEVVRKQAIIVQGMHKG